MKNTNIVAGVLLTVGLGIGFFGGMQYQKNQPQTGRQISFRRFGQSGSNAGAVRGQVISEDNSSITVKLQDGSSKIVLLTSSTMFGQFTEASRSAVIAGSAISVFGTTNPDGSITAANVQLNPLNMGGDSQRSLRSQTGG